MPKKRKKRVNCNQSPFMNKLSRLIMSQTSVFNQNNKDRSAENLFAYKTQKALRKGPK